MTCDDIIRLAQEAGLIHYHDSDGQWSGVTNDQLVDQEKNKWDDKLIQILAPFAALVAAAEREACAKLCDELRDEDGFEPYGTECAAAIRARGER